MTDVLRLAGIEVNVSAPPGPVPVSPSPLPNETPSSLEDARLRARFPVGAPAALGAPEQVILVDVDAAGAPRVVSLLYRGGTIRLDEFDGTMDDIFMKSAPGATWVEVGPDRGLWLPEPHPLTYVDREYGQRTEASRLAGPTLIWQSGQVTCRLEGIGSLAEARAVAMSVS